MSKSDLPARFKKLEDILLESVAPNGSWPHWLNVNSASTSLVGTAHGLAMLRMRGFEFHEPIIGDGLRYLARNVGLHTKVGAGQRGVFSRYPAYALWGLTRYPGALSDREIFRGAKFSADWLVKRARPSGGWVAEGQGSDGQSVSLPATMPAVLGLDRLAPYVRGVDGKKYLRASSRARAAIMAAATSDTGKRSFWRQLEGGRPCPGATSLAVLTLAGGDEDQRKLARKGINYLLAHPDEWTTSVHIDQQLEQLTWRIMTFSVGLRAVLHPCARPQGPNDKVKRAVIEHMDSLWCEPDGAWAFEEGRGPSTTGSYAVVAAIRALKNASEFDPYLGLSGKKKPRVATPRKASAGKEERPKARRRIDVWPSQRRIRIKLEGPHKRKFDVEWGPRATSQWPTFLALLKRQVHAAEIKRRNARKAAPAASSRRTSSRPKRRDQRDSTLSVADLAQYSNSREANAVAVERTIKRINQEIEEASWAANLQIFQTLIEEMNPGDTENEIHYGIEDEETDVVFHADASAG